MNARFAMVLLLASCAGGGGSASSASTQAPVSASIVHVGHDQCIGLGVVALAPLPLYQAPQVGDVLLFIDFAPGLPQTTLPNPPWITAGRSDNYSIYAHVVESSDVTTPLAPYTSFGTVQYGSAVMHGFCISEWSGVNRSDPIATVATNSVSPATLTQSISSPVIVQGGVAYAMFATTDNRRAEPALGAGWTQGDYSNVCSAALCGPLPHTTDISEYAQTNGAVTATVIWPSPGESNAYSALVLLNPQQ